MNRWHVAADRTVTAPVFGRQWTGAPSHRAAINFAQSMAGIDHMLERINLPQLTIARPCPPPPRRHYGFGPAKAIR